MSAPGPIPLVRTDHLDVGGETIGAGATIFVDGVAYRFLSWVENPATGACWADVVGIDNHRYRAFRRERIRLN